MLFDRFRNNYHLHGIAWLVDVWLVAVVVFVLLDLLSPLLHVIHHEGDPSLDLAFVVAEIEPLPLALVDEFFKAISLLFQSPHRAEDHHQLLPSGVCRVERRFLGALGKHDLLGLNRDELGKESFVLISVEIFENSLDVSIQKPSP